MKRVWTAVSLLIVALLGISSIVCCKGAFEYIASRQVNSWFSNHHIIYTSQLTSSQKDDLYSELRNLSGEKRFVAMGRNNERMQSGALVCGFSVLSGATDEKTTVDGLALLGTSIVDDALVRSVCSGGPNDYAGYGNDVSQRVAELPSVRSGLYFRVDQMNSGDGLGDACVFFGLDGDGFEALVEDLSSAVGVSPETLTTKMSGSATGLGLLYMFCAGSFALLSLVLCLLMVTRSLLELKTLGAHLMLGWSKLDFVNDMVSPQALEVLALVPVGVIGAFAALDGFTVNSAFVGYALGSVLPAVVAVLVAAVIAVIPLLLVKPVEAIHGRYSRRGFYVLAVAVYLVCVAAAFAGCIYMDQPLCMYKDLAHTRSAWQEYKDWYVVRDFWLEDGRYKGDLGVYSEDMYAWYAEHEHDKGVYFINSKLFKEAAIKAYGGADMTIKPFWYLAASPSYLEQIGVDIPDELVQEAEQGTRVYLLPESLSASETEQMKDLLVASRKPLDSNIVTRFMENPTYEFASYDAGKELFTWPTDAETPVTSDGFVIALITANNMVYFESESLTATGLESSQIKLDERAASSLLDEEDKAGICGSVSVRFATVGNYIDGLQKSLRELFALFGIVLAVLASTIVAMVMCLVEVVNRVSAREISVKYVLGFGTWELYQGEILFVTIVSLAGIVVCAVAKSNAGMIVGVALLVISNLAIAIASRRRSAAVVLETVSKE